MADLTDHEKQFLALAIRALCMRGGPELFATAARIAEKLGLTAQLGASLRSWIAYAQRQAVERRCARCSRPIDNLSGWHIARSDGGTIEVCGACYVPRRDELVATARGM
jgi:hypothetical protein